MTIIEGIIFGIGVGIGIALVYGFIQFGKRVVTVLTDKDYWKLYKYNKSQRK